MRLVSCEYQQKIWLGVELGEQVISPLFASSMGFDNQFYACAH